MQDILKPTWKIYIVQWGMKYITAPKKKKLFLPFVINEPAALGPDAVQLPNTPSICSFAEYE